MRYIPLEPHAFECGYFSDRQALYEHYFVQEAGLEEREVMLACGYRAFGKYTFRPACVGCQACVPIRVPVRDFRPNKSQKRVLKRCSEVRLEVGEPLFTDEKLALYNTHRKRFPRLEAEQGEDNFRTAFYEPSVPSLEFCYYLEKQLIAVGIVHETPRALSSVYFTYLPDFGRLSLGTFSALQEIAFAASHGKRYFYLGYYIRDNHFMSYKRSFYPSEVLLNQLGWQPFRDWKGRYLMPDHLSFQPFPVITPH